jgi:hypothetical protein
MVDLTPSSIQKNAINRVMENKGLNHYVIVTAEPNIKQALTIKEIKWISLYFSLFIENVLVDLMDNGCKVILALKTPHPFSIVLGYRLRHQTDIEILHYDKQKGDYMEPISLHEILLAPRQ